RKRPGGALGSRPARKRSRLLPSSAGGTSRTEPIDLEESGAPAFEPEFIDVTGDSSEPEVITISDDESPVDREQNQQYPHVSSAAGNSADLLARDDEEEERDVDGYARKKASLNSDFCYMLHVLSSSVSASAQQGVAIRCPICMDSYSEIVRRGRQLMSTLCGHVFCSRCLPIALETTHMCPTCRVELSPELYHPVYL
ncbi:RNF4 ligase, partial [Loxia curvirostra]|nr:RNF4 ligase [Loxia curvirostra]